MDRQKIAKSTFIINLVVLIMTTALSYLLVFKDIQLTSKPLKVFLFLIFNISTIFGLYISTNNKIKPLKVYFLSIILAPIVLTTASVISGNGIAPLYFGGKIIFSTFGDNEKVFEKDKLYLKRSFSLMSNQWYDLYENQGVFEKKLGKFNAGNNFSFADFNLYDSINKKYIRITDTNQTTKIEEIIN